MERSSKFLIVSQPKYKIIRRRTPPPNPPSSGDKQWGETDIRLECITNLSILSSDNTLFHRLLGLDSNCVFINSVWRKGVQIEKVYKQSL